MGPFRVCQSHRLSQDRYRRGQILRPSAGGPHEPGGARERARGDQHIAHESRRDRLRASSQLGMLTGRAPLVPSQDSDCLATLTRVELVGGAGDRAALVDDLRTRRSDRELSPLARDAHGGRRGAIRRRDSLGAIRLGRAKTDGPAPLRQAPRAPAPRAAAVRTPDAGRAAPGRARAGDHACRPR